MTLLTPANLKTHAVFSAGLNALLVVVWALTTRGYFWPIHALLPFAAALALHAWLVLLESRPAIVDRFAGSKALAVHVGAATAQWLYLVVLWLEGGHGYFWPAWALLGLALLAGAHTLKVRARVG